MANELENLPGWAIPAIVGGILLVALMSRDGGSQTPAYNSVIYGPQPSDPGLVGLAQNEVSAKQAILQTAINAFISRDISGINSDRDVTLGSINASVANARTSAAEAVGLADSYNRTKTSIAQAQAAADINRTQVAGATSQAHIAAKESGFNAVVNGISNVVSKLNPFNW